MGIREAKNRWKEYLSEGLSVIEAAYRTQAFYAVLITDWIICDWTSDIPPKWVEAYRFSTRMTQWVTYKK